MLDPHIVKEPDRRQGLRLIVCGGRTYSDRLFLFRALTHLHQSRGISLIIEGGAPGADRLAREWAGENEVQCMTVEAEWQRYGNRAGPLRNKAMLSHQPDGVVAFPGGSGTADMCQQAGEAGIKVWQPARTHQ